MEKNVLSVFLPNFSIELLSRELQSEKIPNKLLITGIVSGKELVLRCSDSVREQKVVPGMNVTDARAHVADAAVYPFQPERERQALTQLALWGYRYTPAINIDTPPKEEDSSRAKIDPRYTGLQLDISTTAHLFGGEAALMRTITEELRKFGFGCRIACAPTRGAAWALSRYSTDPYPVVHNLTALKQQIALLPLSALRLPQSIVQSCQEVGIKRVAELLKLSRAALCSRFDPIMLLRLDAALGLRAETFQPIQPQRTLQYAHTFPEPVQNRELLMQAICSLFDKISDALHSNHKRAGVIGFRVIGRTPPQIERRVTLTMPTLNKRHILRLLEKQVDLLLFHGQLHRQFHGDVERIVLFAEHTEVFQPESLHCFNDEQAALDQRKTWAAFRDRIQSHLGENALCSLVLSESLLPEESFHFESVPSEQTQSEKNPSQKAAHSSSRLATIPPVERPTVLFSIPEQIDAIAVMPDNPPFSVRWRDHCYRVEHGIGPERIAPPWWKKDQTGLAVRDYFRVQLEVGTWLWIYREGQMGRWYVHGIWS